MSALARGGVFDRSVHHARCARAWHLRSLSAPLVSAPPFARPQPSRGARVSRPRSRDIDPSRGVLPALQDRGAASSLRPSAGRASEEEMPRARDVTTQCGTPASTLALLAAWPGPRAPMSEVSAHQCRDPARLPRIRSAIGGPIAEARWGDLGFTGCHHQGLASAFRLPRAVAPLREVNDLGPVQAFRLPVAWRCAPRGALRLSLDATPRCFKSASTTDVRSRAPVVKARSPETLRRAPWENPAGVLLQDPPETGVATFASGRRWTTSRSSSLQRPRA